MVSHCRCLTYHLSLTIFLSSAECCFLRLANSRLSSNSLGALWRWVVVIVITIIIIIMIIIINIIIIITIIHAPIFIILTFVSMINIGASLLPITSWFHAAMVLDYIFFCIISFSEFVFLFFKRLLSKRQRNFMHCNFVF